MSYTGDPGVIMMSGGHCMVTLATPFMEDKRRNRSHSALPIVPLLEGTADILLELFSSEVLPHQGIQSDTAITGKIYPRVAELFCLNIHPDFTPHHTDILDNWSSSDRSRRLVDLHLLVERIGCSTILATIRSILGWPKRYQELEEMNA